MVAFANFKKSILYQSVHTGKIRFGSVCLFSHGLNWVPRSHGGHGIAGVIFITFGQRQIEMDITIRATITSTSYHRFAPESSQPRTVNMDSCDNCARLEEELWRSSEHYVRLIVQHDQMLRDSKPDAIMLDIPIKKARRRRNAAARLLLAHRGTHEDLSLPKTRTAGEL